MISEFLSQNQMAYYEFKRNASISRTLVKKNFKDHKKKKRELHHEMLLKSADDIVLQQKLLNQRTT